VLQIRSSRRRWRLRVSGLVSVAWVGEIQGSTQIGTARAFRQRLANLSNVTMRDRLLTIPTMAPGGVEPPHADSKSAALPLSYGAPAGSSVTDDPRAPGASLAVPARRGQCVEARSWRARGRQRREAARGGRLRRPQ
jgi:hypothetical protein